MGKILANAKERILQIPEKKGISKESFFEKIGATYSNFKGKAKNSSVSAEVLGNILSIYPDVSAHWLVTGEGTMYLTEKASEKNNQNVIPFYGDVATIGGKFMAANNVAASPTAYIHPGDWFPGATAAFRHYGESMLEYPSSCILALKEIKDKEHGIVWGQNYVIEYGDDYNMVTKRLQHNDKGEIMAYSTNLATYPDGMLMHQPFPVYKLHQAFLVLGYIVMSQSNGIMIVPEHTIESAAVTL
jgi:hypothetical protein